MTNLQTKYTLIIEGDDLDAKAARKLKEGDPLKLKRLNDPLDSFEIVVYSPQDKELDMLSYPESLGIAPYMDNGSLKIVSATVISLTCSQGKVRSGDMSYLSFSVEYSFDEELLEPYFSQTGILAFMPCDDCVLTMANYCLLDRGVSPIGQTHLNRYVLSTPLNDASRLIFDLDFKENVQYFFCAQVLFNESFTLCKTSAQVYCEGESYQVDLEENEMLSLIELINHYRILNNQDPVDCQIEQ
ncbi:MAG: hypothetical protein RR198_05535 [Oscillospiraceae bacterium]